MIAMLMFIKFATFGVATEVFFTSVYENAKKLKNKQSLDWSLKGYSFIWMFFIYGLIPFIAPLLIKIFYGMPYLVELFLYSIIILLIEYISGFILKKITGQCPWHYEEGYHLHHLIRFDFIPFWMIFSGLVKWLVLNY